LNREYEKLDPVKLLEQLEQLQSKLFEHTWSSSIIHKTDDSTSPLNNVFEIVGLNTTEVDSESEINNKTSDIAKLNHYRHTKKTDKRKGTRGYRTRKAPF
jgi:glutamine cyclotransferase